MFLNALPIVTRRLRLCTLYVTAGLFGEQLLYSGKKEANTCTELKRNEKEGHAMASLKYWISRFFSYLAGFSTLLPFTKWKHSENCSIIWKVCKTQENDEKFSSSLQLQKGPLKQNLVTLFAYQMLGPKINSRIRVQMISINNKTMLLHKMCPSRLRIYLKLKE